MPNGRDVAQCLNCIHYTTRQDDRNCRLHDFVMPQLSVEVLCKDYKNKRDLSGLDISVLKNLDSEKLYYYLHAASEELEPLDTFNNIQNYVLDIIVRNDDIYRENKLGWIAVIKESQYGFFPGCNQRIVITATGKDMHCKLIETQVLRKQQTVPCRVIVAEGYPNYFYEWLNVHFDMNHVQAVIRQDTQGILATLGLPVFIKTIKSQMRYSLSPPYLMFKNLYGERSISRMVSAK